MIRFMRTTAMGLSCAIVLVVLACLLAGCVRRPVPPGVSRVSAPLEVRQAEVVYQAPNSTGEPLRKDDKRLVSVGDQLSLKDQAEALLTMAAYVVRLYRNTQVKANEAQTKASVVRGTTALNNLALAYGTLYAKQAGEAVAGEYLEITTDTAIIRSLGTEFLVYYDPQTATTWVVVLRDSVEVEGAGARVIVTAGWQTWVTRDNPPAPPSLALRSDIGNRFPSIETLTNGSLTDHQILPNLTSCRVTADPSISVEVREGAEAAATVIATLPRDKPFGAVARSGNGDWVYGYGGDQRGIGWVRVEAITCSMPLASLPVEGGQASVPTPILPPVLSGPTDTPGPSVCVDAVSFVADVTTPDGTLLKPAQQFTKTWRIRNTGSCPWQPTYHLVFATGERLGGLDASLNQPVQPGETIDVSINLVAPTAPGQYRGEWQLANTAGTRFRETVTVVIVVQAAAAPAPPTVTASLPAPVVLPTPTVTPQSLVGSPVPPLLPAPLQVSPKNGSVFDSYPGYATVEWLPVKGADSYTVEVDSCCCGSKQWCSDVGKPWLVQSGITKTSYTFNFASGQRGRWRVWAVDKTGKSGPASEWWSFEYLK